MRRRLIRIGHLRSRVGLVRIPAVVEVRADMSCSRVGMSLRARPGPLNCSAAAGTPCGAAVAPRFELAPALLAKLASVVLAAAPALLYCPPGARRDGSDRWRPARNLSPESALCEAAALP